MRTVYILIPLISLLGLLAFLLTKSGTRLGSLIKFYSTGYDSGFKTREITLLWQTGKTAALDEPSALFWSVPTLNKSIAGILKKVKNEGRENDPGIQDFLSRLYAYRTKVEFDQAKYKRGITSSRSITEGQKLRILLKGHGVFTSVILLNAPKGLTISWPVKPGLLTTGINWNNRQLTVYFWRKDDAGYAFDAAVKDVIRVQGQSAIVLPHVNDLVRSQKRKSIRVPCSIYAQLYLANPEAKDPEALEADPGLKCLLEDISEDGALIRIGGKGNTGMYIKLQFTIQDIFILMYGTVKGVEYNEDTHQSRLHFESGELNPRMKNAILSYVYNVLPPEEKDIMDAIRLAEEDGEDEMERNVENSAETEPVL